MRKSRSHLAVALAASAVVPALFASSAKAQAVYSGGTYNQNFDGLPNSGSVTNFTGQAAYDLSSFSSTLAGVQISRNASASGTTAFMVGTGSANTGAVYSFGSTGSSDRALGSVSSNTNPGGVGAAFWYYGIVLTNNTGGTLTDFTLSYDGEEWRDGGNTVPVAQKLAFSYNVSSSPLTIASAGFTPLTALDFVSPKFGTTGVALDGNAAANRTAGITASVSGLSWNAGDTLVLRWADASDANNDLGLSIDNVTFSATGSIFTPRSLTYTGGQTSDFDTTHLNFTDGSSAVAYAENGAGTTGDSVAFTGNAPGTVNIQAGGVSPATVVVSGDQNYTFAGGPIKGNGGLAKSGGGTLVLSAANTFSGGANGVVVSGGTLEVAHPNALGSSPLGLSSGGRAQFDVTASVATLNVLDEGGGELNVAAGQTVTAGVITAAGVTLINPYFFSKTGDGTLAVTSTLPDSLLLNIGGGKLQLNQTSGTTNIFVSPQWGSATAGDLVINGPFRVNLKSNFAGTVGAPGSAGHIVLAVPSLGSNSSQLTSIQANTGSSVDLNVGVVLGGSSAADKFALGASSGAGGILRVNAPVTGTGTLYLAAQKTAAGGTNYIAGGTGVIELHASSTFAGDVYVGLAAGGTVKSFVDNALPTTATLHFGDENLPATATSGTNTTTFSVGTVDLNGTNQSISGVASNVDPAVVIGGISNTAGSTSTLTLVGGNTTSYAGPIGDHVNVAADASFSGVQTLTAALNTTAKVSAAGGKIVLAPAAGTVSRIGTVAAGGAGVVALATSAPHGLVVTSSPELTGGTLDLGNSDMVIHGSTASAIGALVGHGLTSTLAGTGSGADLYAGIGVIGNDDGKGGTLFPAFDGEPVSMADVLVKYTYVGDTDLNGYVDGADLANLLAGESGHLHGWINGDLNYDGQVDDADLGLLMNSLRNQGAPFNNSTGATGGAVPEPTAMGLLVPAAGILVRRRRRA